MTSIDGNPNVLVNVNNSSGPGGAFVVRDGTSPRFHVSEDGDVTLYGDVAKSSGTLRIDGGTSDPYVRLSNGVQVMDFKYDTTNGGHEIWVDASFLRLDAYGVIELQGGHAADDIVTVHGGSSGDKVLTISHDSSNDRVEIASSTISSTAQKLKVSSPSTLELVGNTIDIDSSGTIDIDGTTITVDGTTIALTASGDITLDSGGDMLARADERMEFHFNEDSGGDSAYFYNANGTTQAVTVLQISNDHRLEMWGGKGSGTSTFEVDADAPGDDAILRIGDGEEDGNRGVVEIRQDDGQSAAKRAGILKLQGENGTFCYLWFRESGGTYELLCARSDPGVDDTDGGFVATVIP